MHTVIVGNGVAGITAARHLRKHAKRERITVISEESDYFFSRTALMYVYMGHMKYANIKPYADGFWAKNRIDLVRARVGRVDTGAQQLLLSTSERMGYDRLVIATGSKSRFFGWPGQDLKGVQGLYSLGDLEYLEAHTPAPFENGHPVRKAVIVGGGLIGVELAEMLLSRGIETTMLVRETHLWGNVLTREEGRLLGNHLRSHGVDLRTDAELQEILGDEGGAARGVVTQKGEEIECQWVGLATGVAPNIGFLEGSGIATDKGVLVDDKLQTNLPRVYAVGDCAQLRQPPGHRKAIEPVWYVARMMGEVLGRRLGGKPDVYAPGPWFNSAKFFDIEYQVYGDVQADPEGKQAHYFIELEPGRKFMTIAYHPDSLTLQGVNAFGVRLRHEVLDAWLRQKAPVAEVVGGIEAANFDTEFYHKWPAVLKSDFRRTTGIVPVTAKQNQVPQTSPKP